MKIEVRQGDIADQPDLDAVVNAANTELWMGSGVAGALKRRGGEAVEREAVTQGPIALGEAVRTPAGGLPNHHVIHAAAMGYRPEDEEVSKRAGSRSSADIIRRATLRSLALADEAGDQSIGFPALATGVGGFPIDECARVMIAAAREYAGTHPLTKVELVRFVVRSDEDRSVFDQALEVGG
ncbi:MAG TPA: macro domain-containing protein [Candidatus Limnocylindria bacterium]|jgi:O-acetyl-ADP-ribose deacetylase (regulator of RNase III)|nr:macro domain-containing protein [Candidatus Limnocylindria bacterium]